MHKERAATPARPLVVHPIILRTVTVTHIQDISPTMRRFRFAGPQLQAGVRDEVAVTQFLSNGFDDHIKIVFPDLNGTYPNPGIQIPGRVKWTREGLMNSRDYTVRRWGKDWLEIDVVLHEGGLATTWAQRAKVGDTIDFAGPKSSALIPDDVDWFLLLADETALPAVGRFLEEAHPRMKAQVLVSVPCRDDIQELPSRADAQVDWLVRSENTQENELFGALKRFTPWPGKPFVWAAGEANMLAPIRRFLRTAWGLTRDQFEVSGYWRDNAGKR